MWWASPFRVLIGAYLGTLRLEERNSAALHTLLQEGRPFVFVFWHGSMIYPWWRLRYQNAACLVSRSKDGEILSSILRGWGYHLIRGSSSKGSAESMAAMRQAILQGHILSVTPDGPRGPRHVLKMGAVRVAQTMRVPLLMAAAGFRSRRVLRSWDAFEIPYPFSRGIVEFADALTIEPGLEGDALEAMRLNIEMQMIDLYRRVTSAAGRHR